MSIIIKDENDIKYMRISGKLAAEVLDYIQPFVKPGVTTNELDKLCHDYIVNVQQAYPSPLNYQPKPDEPAYPKSICTSINSEICHGIPNDKPLKNGDIVNIDVTVYKNLYHGDTSRMFLVGEVSPHAKRLCWVTYECMWLGIKQVKPGNYLGDIGNVIAAHASKNGYSVVQDFCGHGIGRGFHESPQVLHYGRPKTGVMLEPGMIFTIEPMINQGKRFVKFMSNGWTAVTKDRSLSAQWEHTILVTNTGYEVLTISDGMPPPPKFIGSI
ncbi:MAG: type I methionyl aminopeptidase [Burkholderiales bacterium]|nr:type I methionyl aminopeptidase [Burkholderiales bacterium]